MGTKQIFLWIFLGHFTAAQAVLRYQDAMFSHNFADFFENLMPFPFERNFDLTPYDTIFSSWQTRTPAFHMLSEFPPVMNMPRVQVFCDDSKITLLVDKRANGLKLTGEELQLGNGCYSNRELPNQFVFTYPFDQCGTTHVMQDGFKVFTNSLHLRLRKILPMWWQTPPTVQVSCIPKRLYDSPHDLVPMPPANGRSFDIKTMNPSWTNAAESNVYKRGQAVNLQVSAKTTPTQQLFIQSCFVSASPDPHTRPRHAIILNKGCTTPLGSPHAVIQYVASNRPDVVNFVLNTTYLISELYVHCSVLISNQGVTQGSKSCNYNVVQSRWDELSGAGEVCDCCSSKCKGPFTKSLANDAKAIVSTGPLVIADKDGEISLALPPSEPQEALKNNFVKSDVPAEEMIVTGSTFPPPPQGVVVVSQDPTSRLTVWLPRWVQGTEQKDQTGSEEKLTVQLQPSNVDVPELQPSTIKHEPHLNPSTNPIEDQALNRHKNGASMWDLNLLTVDDGWPSQPDNAVIAEEVQKNKFSGSRKFDTQTAQGDLSLPAEISVNYFMLVDGPNPPEPVNVAIAEDSQKKKWLPAEMTVGDPNKNDLNKQHDDPAQTDAAEISEGTNEDQPIIRSKLEFSKSADGSRTLSYEEDTKQHEEKSGRFVRDGMKRKQEPRLKGLRSTFLYLLRRMDKTE